MKKIGMLIDSIELIDGSSDSTPALAEAMQKRGWEIHYFQGKNISLFNDVPMVTTQKLHVLEVIKTSLKPTVKRGSAQLSKIINQKKWYQLDAPQFMPFTKLDAVLVRKDPPFQLEYLHFTYLLDFVEKENVLLINSPKAIRDTNDKTFIYRYPQCTPESIITSDQQLFRKFLNKHKEIICKPIDGTRGESIFHVKQNDSNANVIFETMTDCGENPVVCQRYISAVKKGDKRIFLIDGKPIPYALARIPVGTECRANLAAGGIPKGVKLTKRDYWICEQMGADLRDAGLLFVGIDVIGDYLTEINVVNLACAREINAIFGINIDDMLLDCIEKKIKQHKRKNKSGVK